MDIVFYLFLSIKEQSILSFLIFVNREIWNFTRISRLLIIVLSVRFYRRYYLDRGKKSSISLEIFRVSIMQKLTHESRFLRAESTVPEQRDEKSRTRRFNVPFNKRITKSNREFV